MESESESEKKVDAVEAAESDLLIRCPNVQCEGHIEAGQQTCFWCGAWRHQNDKY